MEDSLGGRIREHRLHVAKKTLRQLAVMAKISPSYLSQIENGVALNPSSHVLASIFMALGWDGSGKFLLEKNGKVADRVRRAYRGMRE